MADWYLNRALTGFRNAVNAAYPNRDKGSDGTIGDPAHAARSSDHNRDSDGSVDAWDMDVDLRSGNDAAAIAELKRVFQAHPSSSYWIHNDQISFRDEGWRPRSYAYAGANRNQHRHHVHWNTRGSHEGSTAPWILKEEDMAIGDDIYHLLHDGRRPETLPQTAGGGVPIAWLPREIGEVQKALSDLGSALALQAERIARIEQHLTQGGGSPGVITQEMLNEAVRTVMGSVDNTPQA